MVIRDVDHWVSQIIDLIRSSRTHLSQEDRALQATILNSLSTQQFSVTLPEGQVAIEFSDKKGIVNEYLVRLDPEFASREMTEIETAVEAYLLGFLRTYSPHFPLIPNKKFHSPDGFVIRMEGKKAWIDVIIEIKTTGFSEDMKRQLRGIIEDLEWVVWLINRNLENIRRHVGVKPLMPDVGQVPWPIKIKSIKLNPEYRKILYLSADREVRNGEFEGWTVRRSRFSISEVTRITHFVWKDLVAKGGASATTREEEDSVAVNRAPTFREDRRQSDAVDVRKHDTGQECSDMAKRNTVPRPMVAEACRNLREGGKACGNPLPTDQDYYLDKERTLKGCERCAAENCAGQLRHVRQNIIDDLEIAKKFAPDWDDKPMGRYAQAEFKRIQTELLPIRKFLPGLVDARNVRVKVDNAVVTAMIAGVREVLSSEESSWLTRGFLAQAEKIEADQKSQRGQDLKIQRGNSYNLVSQAVSLCEEVGERASIEDRVDYINKGLIVEITTSLEPYVETAIGKVLIDKLVTVKLRAEQFENLDFYCNGNKSSVESSRLLQTARALKGEAAEIESKLSQASLVEEVIGDLDLSFGFEDEEDVSEVQTTMAVETPGDPDGEEEVDGASTIGALLTPEQKATLRQQCAEEPAPTVVAESAVEAAVAEVGECQGCGFKNAVGIKFCGECGATLPEPAKTLTPARDAVDKVAEMLEAGQGSDTSPEADALDADEEEAEDNSEADEPSPVPVAAASAAPAPVETKFCVYCGTAGLPLAAMFCSICGKAQ